MAHRVGTKGQVVIQKEIRDKLGIQPGWLSVQAVVGNHVELRFLPPEHTRSLRGALADHIKATAPSSAKLRSIRERLWNAAAAEQEK